MSQLQWKKTTYQRPSRDEEFYDLYWGEENIGWVSVHDRFDPPFFLATASFRDHTTSIKQFLTLEEAQQALLDYSTKFYQEECEKYREELKHMMALREALLSEEPISVVSTDLMSMW